MALSGTGIADWAVEVNPLRVFQQQVQSSGLSKAATETHRMAVRELRRLDAKKLFADSLQFAKDNDRLTVFKPTIEAKSATAFLTDNPKTIWKAGTYKQRPLLLSFVPVEGGWMAPLFRSQAALTKANANMDSILEHALELKAENVMKAKQRYLNGTERMGLDDAKAVLQVSRRRSDCSRLSLVMQTQFPFRWWAIAASTIRCTRQCTST